MCCKIKPMKSITIAAYCIKFVIFKFFFANSSSSKFPKGSPSTAATSMSCHAETTNQLTLRSIVTMLAPLIDKVYTLLQPIATT